jgi:hypothetical protein
MTYQGQTDRDAETDANADANCSHVGKTRQDISQRAPGEPENAAQGQTAHDRVMAAIALEMQAKARCSVASIIKARARQLMRQPMQLDVIAPKLATASPVELIAIGLKILSGEMQNPRRFFGFGGEIPALNAKAVILLGRYQRRLQAQQLYLFAAE